MAHRWTKRKAAGSLGVWLAGLLLGTTLTYGQVVQLPSYRNFSYSGGAVVPDRGTAALGGGHGQHDGSVARGTGPHANRTGGSQTSAGSLSVSAEVIDLHALDEAILSGNAVSGSASQVPSAEDTDSDPDAEQDIGVAVAHERSFVSGVDRKPRRTGAGSLSDYTGRWQRTMGSGVAHADSLDRVQHPNQVESNIRYYLQRGKEAEAANRIISARVYYRMAIEAMTPEMIERYQRLVAERQVEEERRRQQLLDSGRRRF